MPYPWTALDILTAEDLNAAISALDVRIDNFEAPARCYAYQTAAQTLTTGVAANVTLTAELVDSTGSMHSTVTNTSRIVVPTTGWYRIYAGVGFASNATGFRLIQVTLNGGAIAQQRVPAISGASSVISLAFEYAAAAGQYFEVQAQQNSGGNLDTAPGAGITYLHVVRVSN